MPNEYEVAAKRIGDSIAEDGPLAAETDWTVLTALIRSAVDSLAWNTMNYKCDECGFEWEVYLTLGLEGPPELKKIGLALPVPFVGGSCPAWRPPKGSPVLADLTNLKPCGGSMTHVDWARDRRLEPPELIPDDAPRFVLPSSSAGGGQAPCGRLEIPTPALVRARSSWEEDR